MTEIKKNSNPESPEDFHSVLRFIIFAGVLLDSYSVYSFWRELNDNKSLNAMLEKNGLNGGEFDIPSFVSTLQKGGTLALLVFLIFDFLAYYFLFEYKNWARKYVVSIAIFYLIGCIFDFSWIYFGYSIFTIYYLFKPRKEFLIS
jgi:hypothetical protein